MKNPILPLLALSAALCGCPQENHASVEFFAICGNPTPDTSGCTYSATCDSIATLPYRYDPTVAPDLLVPIEFFNQLPNNADLSSGRVNTNDAVIQQWRFEYVYAGIIFATAAESVAVVIPAGAHQTAIVPVVPTSLNALMTGLVGVDFDVNVRAAGRFLDETYFETGPFKVPAGVRSAPFTSLTCGTGSLLAGCPQDGQSGAYACVPP